MKKIYSLVVLLLPLKAYSYNEIFLGGGEVIEIDSILISTKLKTARKDAPVSITKITSDQIKKNKFRNIAEALKSVPGMVVVEPHSSEHIYQVGYHGGNTFVPRRMNVLIDGVSFYQAGFSRVRWDILPVNIHDVFSIEVIRGAAASLYGSNSFTSVVNITTKSPEQTVGNKGELGWFVNAFKGQGGVEDYSARYTFFLDDLGFIVSYSHIEDDGFDKTLLGEPRYDSKDVNMLKVNINYDLDESKKFNLILSSTNQKVQEQFVAPIQTSFPDYEINSNYIALTFKFDISTDHELKILGYHKNDEHYQSWDAQVPAFSLSPELSLMYDMNPNYALSIASGNFPTGGSSFDDIQAFKVYQQIASLDGKGLELISATVLQNYTEKQYTLEVQDTYKYNKYMRFVVGASISHAKTSNYDWVIDKPVSLVTKRIYGNTEYNINDNWLANVGASFEYDKNSGGFFSPRFALNNFYFDDLSLRFVFSKAERTPDSFEQKANWRYIGTDLSDNPFNDEDKLTYFIKAVAKGDLDAERIESYEIGALYEFSSKLSFDTRFFLEKQTLLISEKLSFTDFRPTNNGHSTIKGVDLELSYSFSSRATIDMSYSYTDVSGTENEKTMSVNNVFYSSVNYKLSENISANFYYYGLSKFLGETEHNFGEPFVSPSNDLFDFNVSYEGAIEGVGLFSISFNLKHRNNHSEFETDNFYSDRNAFFINTGVSF